LVLEVTRGGGKAEEEVMNRGRGEERRKRKKKMRKVGEGCKGRKGDEKVGLVKGSHLFFAGKLMSFIYFLIRNLLGLFLFYFMLHPKK
jgi:hypothetical protein